ncbi:hypothetical protein [Metapseudomonas boanensis]|uniref:Uncharacterized protein n=1 Tax=Metapseudomonas boanensis TaxID=2822138 RepID=A0ABS5XL20_9GAMM|nr:hypothetical protein [Pseudomonas boanensis]MBT8768409.1 hypothetical protein [Pseudomonas boanensis]
MRLSVAAAGGKCSGQFFALGQGRAVWAYDAMDQINLPDVIKQLLKLIRAIKAQFVEKQA